MKTQLSQTDQKIVYEIYKAMEKLGAQSDLLSIIGSWKDTIPDEMILDMMENWNKWNETMSCIAKQKDLPIN